MSPLSLQPDQARRASRRRVRIVKRRRISRGALVTFILGAAAAVSFPLLWYVRRPPVPIESVREPVAPECEWKCNGGHTFRAPFRMDSSVCSRCDRRAFPVGWYTCGVHGSFEVAAQFIRREDGRVVVSRLRMTGRKWVTEDELACPHCDRPLLYKGRDPLERASRNQKPGGS